MFVYSTFRKLDILCYNFIHLMGYVCLHDVSGIGSTTAFMLELHFLRYACLRDVSEVESTMLQLCPYDGACLFARPFGSWSIITVILELCQFSGVDTFTRPINTVYANRIRRPSVVSIVCQGDSPELLFVTR
jgi:hypothetical protein